MEAFDIQDNATQGLQRFLQTLESSSILEAMVAAVKVDVQDHFLQLPANKYGWPSTHFWAKAAQATNSRVSGLQGEVNVNGPIGITQRFYGGDIFPVNAKLLTLPARAEAYGHRAREFHNLVMLWGRRGPYALAEADAQQVSFGRTKKDGTRTVKQGDVIGGGIMFWLVKEVHQEPDPNVLPSDEEMSGVALDAGQRAMQRAKGRAGLATEGGLN